MLGSRHLSVSILAAPWVQVTIAPTRWTRNWAEGWRGWLGISQLMREFRSAHPQTGVLASMPQMSTWFPRIWQWHPESGISCLVLKDLPQTLFDQNKTNILGLKFGNFPLWGSARLSKEDERQLFQ